MTAGTIVSTITEVQSVGDTILQTLEGLDPALDMPAATAQTVLDLVSQLVSTALTAFSVASGTPITVETVQALLPNSTPLTAPDTSS